MKTLFLIIFVICFIIYYLWFRSLHSSTLVTSGNNNIFADKLMIVAHPDDELIFGGRELIEHSGWKVVCITNGTIKSNNFIKRGNHNYRKDEFINMMKTLGHQYEIWDYEDNLFNSNWNRKLIISQLKNLINEYSYKIILTHNLQGEYGHIQHKHVSKLVHGLHPKNLYVFDTDENINNPYMDKILLISKIYGSQKKIIEKNQKYIIHQSKKLVSSISNI
ncbi:glcnac-pide-N-acetylase [Cotonvirus japonicus]|uniref:Glcnac-pide-N-acetylase n=1 Tax=Cotonvirus japonicus TaxID=2811091 RepID=A0ABM7NSU6_9VIRU|nr:glcnac-pide-N-acetylase [Cotonvirus japonicus]BCS83181.1 glcnac-pide-N-acetylase [Cotonvirus japonicus]